MECANLPNDVFLGVYSYERLEPAVPNIALEQLPMMFNSMNEFAVDSRLSLGTMARLMHTNQVEESKGQETEQSRIKPI